MKKAHASRKSKTHFEQVPLEVVKKIAEGDDSNHEKAGTDNSIVEPDLERVRRVRQETAAKG